MTIRRAVLAYVLLVVGLFELCFAANNTTGSGNTTRSSSVPTPTPAPVPQPAAPPAPVQLCSITYDEGPCLYDERALLARFISFAAQGNNAASFLAKNMASDLLRLWCNDPKDEKACQAAGKYCKWYTDEQDAYSICTLDKAIEQELDAYAADRWYCPGALAHGQYVCSSQSSAAENTTQAQARCKALAQDGCVWAVKGGSGQCTTSDLAKMSDKDFAAVVKQLSDDQNTGAYRPELYGCCATTIKWYLDTRCAGSFSKSACGKFKQCSWSEASVWDMFGDYCGIVPLEEYRQMLPKAMVDLIAKDQAACAAAAPKEEKSFLGSLFGALFGSDNEEDKQAAEAKRRAACAAVTLKPTELKGAGMEETVAAFRAAPKSPDAKTCPKTFTPIS